MSAGIPKDAEGTTLHEGDRVYAYDVKDNGYERVYGTLVISDHPSTFGQWCVDYDDGESFIVLSFQNIWKALAKNGSVEKNEQKQNLIDLMKTDEEHGMYDK